MLDSVVSSGRMRGSPAAAVVLAGSLAGVLEKKLRISLTEKKV